MLSQAAQGAPGALEPQHGQLIPPLTDHLQQGDLASLGTVWPFPKAQSDFLCGTGPTSPVCPWQSCSPQKIRVFLPGKVLWELLHTRELIQVGITISPAPQSLCAWLSSCPGLWATPGHPNSCWSSASPEGAREGHRDDQ